MANRESIFDKYNMSAGERRVVMFVVVVLIGVLAWMAFDIIPKPEQTNVKISKIKPVSYTHLTLPTKRIV